ncbi:unnamed protein product [Spirodela intermedia]|uniref:Uncharacterized protein n=1 Tax=Spirodela intermedia TaxID=51605 RepID=A0A7I8ILR7_SPIIN|nr:unnamed protein product [Spirodela intermedia]CAA6658775.1 unnamed protein product [Spirodela intermedia]
MGPRIGAPFASPHLKRRLLPPLPSPPLRFLLR